MKNGKIRFCIFRSKFLTDAKHSPYAVHWTRSPKKRESQLQVQIIKEFHHPSDSQPFSVVCTPKHQKTFNGTPTKAYENLKIYTQILI